MAGVLIGHVYDKIN